MAIADHAIMKNVFFFLTIALALASGHNHAAALDAELVSARSEQTTKISSASQTPAAQQNVASNAACREIDVAVDEGYGVSGYETRSECAEPAR